MTVYGGITVQYENRGRCNTRVSYNRVTQLAEVNVGGDVALTLTLNATQLSALAGECNRALGLMLEDPGAIGYDAVTAVTHRDIDRLEHLIASTGIRPLGGAYE